MSRNSWVAARALALALSVVVSAGGVGCGSVAGKISGAGGGTGGIGTGGGSGLGGSGVGSGGAGGVGDASVGQDAGTGGAPIVDAADGSDRSDSPSSATITAVSLTDINVFAAPAATFTKVPYVTELFDDANEFDTTTNRFTAAAAGDYQICASLTSSPDLTHPFELDLYINGTRENSIGGIGGHGFEQGCRVVRLAASDYVEVWVYPESPGAAVMFAKNSLWNWLTISKVKATASVRDITTFAAATATFTKVPFATKVYDDQSQFDVSNSRFTAAGAGDYEVCASLTSSPNLTHPFELDLYVNGAREDAFAGEVGGGNGFEHGCRVVRLAAGSFVEVWVLQSSGAAMTFAPNTYWNWLTVTKLPTTVSLDDASAFSAASGVFTKVPYISKLFDDGTQFDTGTSRFMAADSGDYLICASLTSYPNSSILSFELDLYINGARSTAFAGSGANGFQHGCRLARLVAGNYVEVWAYQASGAAVSFSQNSFGNWLTVSKVRP